jgi:hypothetical protein
VALARRYAALLDEPAPRQSYRKALGMLSRMAEHCRTTMHLTPLDARALDEAVETITTALGEHSVASDLGPKFLAVLQALGLVLPAQKGASGDGPKPATTRDELKARRVDRAHRAKIVDATSS